MNRQIVLPAYLVCCLILGGASAAGFVANLLLQLLALPLIGWAGWQLLTQRTRLSPPIVSLLLLLAALIGAVLIELVPLPPALWTLLPGRGPVVAGYRLLGLPLPWLPLTLAPDAAVASVLWLLPAIACLFAAVLLGAFRASWVAGAILALTLASIALGALQVIGGETAYVYAFTNVGVAVGFFANANHNATLILVCIPFLAALAATWLKQSKSRQSASAIRLLVAGLYAILFVGLVLNTSLAGLGLSVPVALSSWLIFGRQRAGVRRGLAVVAAVLTVAALVGVARNPGNNLVGKQSSNVELSRQTSFALTVRAAGQYFPFGSGTGSFQPIYRTQEPLATITNTYMNHAHSDWLELLLETGMAGIVLAAGFLAWWFARVRALWQATEREPFVPAAVVASAAMMLHSIVDYPLRTAALSAVFATCLGLMAGARPHRQRDRRTSGARHLTL